MGLSAERTVLGEKIKDVERKWERAGRSRERLQTLCEPDPEGRKKGKLYIVLQEILQFNRVERPVWETGLLPPDKIAHQRNVSF